MTLLYLDDNFTKVQATCERCGSTWTFSSRQLTRDYDSTTCADCKAKPQRHVIKNGLRCTPWDGEFDLDNNHPLKDGKPYMIGPRKCGNADCVNKNHVLGIEALIAEQFDLSYRTGIKLDYAGLKRAVRREQIR